jgi:hypothetical protein
VELKIRRYPVAGYPFRNSFSRRISLEVLCERTPTVLSKSTEREADRVLRLLIFRNSSARVSETLCLTRRDSDRNRRLAPLVFQQLNFTGWPQFCDHSVTSADVRLRVGPNLSPADRPRPVDLAGSTHGLVAYQNATLFRWIVDTRAPCLKHAR